MAFDLHDLWFVIPLLVRLFNTFQRNRNFSVPILVYHSTILFFKSSQGICIKCVHLGNRESSTGEESTMKGHSEYEVPQYSLRAWSSFSGSGQNLFVCGVVAFQYLKTHPGIDWKPIHTNGGYILLIHCSWEVLHIPCPLYRKNSSQVFITWPEIKGINRNILSKQVHSFTCHAEMPGGSRFYIGFFFFNLYHEYVMKAFRYWASSSFGSHQWI